MENDEVAKVVGKGAMSAEEAKDLLEDIVKALREYVGYQKENNESIIELKKELEVAKQAKMLFEKHFGGMKNHGIIQKEDNETGILVERIENELKARKSTLFNLETLMIRGLTDVLQEHKRAAVPINLGETTTDVCETFINIRENRAHHEETNDAMPVIENNKEEKIEEKKEEVVETTIVEETPTELTEKKEEKEETPKEEEEPPKKSEGIKYFTFMDAFRNDTTKIESEEEALDFEEESEDDSSYQSVVDRVLSIRDGNSNRQAELVVPKKELVVAEVTSPISSNMEDLDKKIKEITDRKISFNKRMKLKIKKIGGMRQFSDTTNFDYQKLNGLLLESGPNRKVTFGDDIFLGLMLIEDKNELMRFLKNSYEFSFYGISHKHIQDPFLATERWYLMSMAPSAYRFINSREFDTSKDFHNLYSFRVKKYRNILTGIPLQIDFPFKEYGLLDFKELFKKEKFKEEKFKTRDSVYNHFNFFFHK